MKHTKVGVGVVVLLLSAVLGATVLREPIATAASPFQSVIIGNTAAQPVPVQQQGAADVNVTNSTLAIQPQAPISGGGGSAIFRGGQGGGIGGTATASALAINLTDGVIRVALTKDGSNVVVLEGPASVAGNGNYQLPLSRPISFDRVECLGEGNQRCGVSWVGNDS